MAILAPAGRLSLSGQSRVRGELELRRDAALVTAGLLPSILGKLWDITYFIERFGPKLPLDSADFLAPFTVILNDRPRVSALDENRFPAWRKAPPQPLESTSMNKPIWQTYRVFISGTFRDMHADRDHLVKVVFRALHEKLEKHRVRLVPCPAANLGSWAGPSAIQSARLAASLSHSCGRA